MSYNRLLGECDSTVANEVSGEADLTREYQELLKIAERVIRENEAFLRRLGSERIRLTATV